MMNVSINAPSVQEFREAGGSPEYVVTPWPGDWVLKETDPKAAVVRLIDDAKSKELKPYLNDYGYGDDITLAAVKGTAATPDGWTRAKQIMLTKAIADAIAARGGPYLGALVVVEPEFFKNDVMNDGGAAFDSLFKECADILHAVGARVILSPGLWGEFKNNPEAFLARLPKSVAAADYIGIQALRSVPRNGAADYDACPDLLLSSAKKLHAITGDLVVIADICASSYGGNVSSTKPFAPVGYVDNPTTEAQKAENARLLAVAGRAEEDRQRRFWARMAELRPQFDEHAAHAFPRSLRDTDMKPSNYHGLAEKSWGLMRRDGTKKPAFEPFMQFARSGSDLQEMYRKAVADRDAAVEALTVEQAARRQCAERVAIVEGRLRRIRDIATETP